MRNLRCAQYARKWASQISNSMSSHKKIEIAAQFNFGFPSHFFLLVGKMYMSKFFLDLPAKGGDVLLSLIPPLTSYVWRLLSMASHVA